MKTKELDKVLVVDFGSQTTKLIIRRIREIGFECEVIAYDELSNCIQNVKPKALILSGGPASSFKIKSPKIDIRILKMGIPVLGICYGMQLICHTLGGRVQSTNKREFGKAIIKVLSNDLLLKGINNTKKSSQVWMSHGDEVTILP